MNNWGLFLGGQADRGCEVDHSPPSSDEVKDVWYYNFTPLICLYGVYRDNIMFSLNSFSKP